MSDTKCTLFCMTRQAKGLSFLASILGTMGDTCSCWTTAHVAVSRGNVTSIWDGKRIHHFDGVLLVAVGRTAIVCRIQCAGNRCHAAFVKIAAPDTEQELFKIPTSGVVPVATDAANRIILGDHGCVRILNPNYNVERTITGAGKNGVALKSITAVAADHKNNIFAVDYWNDGYSYTKFVHMFDANGAFLKSDPG